MNSTTTAKVIKRALGRRDPVVAAVGLTLALVFVLSLGGAAWWSHTKQTELVQGERLSQAQTLGTTMCASAEVLLSADQTTGLRRFIVESAREHRLIRASVVLGDGRIVADTDVSRIDTMQIPESWNGSIAGDMSLRRENGVIKIAAPFSVAGRGPASLEMTIRAGAIGGSMLDEQAGTIGIGVIGLIVLLFAYRAVDTRFGALGAVGRSLQAFRKGEQDFDVLAVTERFGAEAIGWNLALGRIFAQQSEILAVQAGESLRERRVRGGDLSEVCDAMWQGLLVVDDNLRVRYANGAAAVFLRQDRETLAGTEVEAAIDAEDVLEAVRQVASGTAQQRATIEVERKDTDEKCILRYTVRPVRRDDKASALVMIEDVTQQRVADEARNGFVAQATHELRTPLTNIKLYVEEAVDAPEHDVATRNRCLNVINQESRRLERIVGDMLSVSQIEAGSMQINQGDVRVDTLFHELEEDFRASAAEKDITLRFDLSPKLPVASGDRDKLTLAVHNLVGNAIKYTPAGGEVTVRVVQQDGELVVSVSDNGIGIGHDEQERIFEKFYRARDRRLAHITGSGLGLALAREVVRLHGGDITVDSEPERGSTFTMTVPLPERAAA